MVVAYGIKVKITTLSLIAIGVTAGFFSPQGHTGVPAVAVDIPPVASLVRQVMGDLGQPRLIMPTGVSPHSYAMRPSQARTLQNADIVFWVGRDLTVGLARAIKALATNAVSVSLIDVPGITLLPFRHGTTFEAHDHNNGTDPHVWLDPENARVWLEVIAAELAKLDPDNASSYLHRARVGRNALKELTHHLSVQLARIRGPAICGISRCLSVFRASFQHESGRIHCSQRGVRSGAGADRRNS